MKDWDEPIDKSPPIEEPVHKHKKYRKGKKSFVIECRYIGTGCLFSFDYCVWHVHKRYKTEKQRNQAFEALMNRKNTPFSNWEYRIEQNTSGE